MKPLISVILPIYRVEKYLERAVRSVIQQTYDNLEIILVEDGSPDFCGKICDRLAGKDARIKVIHKENGGLSDARNTGLDAAKGEYISFIDSDDYVAPEFIDTLYQACVKTGSQIAFCEYQETTGSTLFTNRLLKPYSQLRLETYSSRELNLNMYEEMNPHYTCFVVAWNKLYHRSLWGKIRFPAGRIHEDEATTYKIFDDVEQGVFVREALYGYYLSESSITRDKFTLKRLDWLKALKERIIFFVEKGDGELILRAFKAFADTSITFYRKVEPTKENQGKKAELKRNVRTTLASVKKYGGLSAQTMIGYHIFLWSPGLYYMILDNMLLRKDETDEPQD